jgi:hypothetical protein
MIDSILRSHNELTNIATRKALDIHRNKIVNHTAVQSQRPKRGELCVNLVLGHASLIRELPLSS